MLLYSRGVFRPDSSRDFGDENNFTLSVPPKVKGSLDFFFISAQSKNTVKDFKLFCC